MGALSPPEYAVLTEWYEWLEKKADIGLDLIGNLSPFQLHFNEKFRNLS